MKHIDHFPRSILLLNQRSRVLASWRCHYGREYAKTMSLINKLVVVNSVFERLSSVLVMVSTCLSRRRGEATGASARLMNPALKGQVPA